jgi:Protein of unknown function (DUF2380)
MSRSPPTATFDPLESRVCEADIATHRRNPFLTPFPDRESSKFPFSLARARRDCPKTSEIVVGDILNINVYMEDAESGKMKFARSVDIRGNTDESWRRGLDYLLRNYLLREP